MRREERERERERKRERGGGFLLLLLLLFISLIFQIVSFYLSKDVLLCLCVEIKPRLFHRRTKCWRD